MEMNLEHKKYKLGYAMVVINEPNLECFEWLKTALEKCDRFVLGIPDEWVTARIFGD